MDLIEEFVAFDLNLKDDKPGWKKTKPVDRFYVEYDPKNKFPTNEATLHNQIENEVNSFTSAVCVTNESNQIFTPPHRKLLRWHFRLGHIGFQHVQWLISTGRMKVQVNSNAVANCESPKCAACDFGMSIIDRIK